MIELSMNTLFWRMNRVNGDDGKLAIRITIGGKLANATITKELQKMIASHPNLVWNSKEQFYEGPGSGRVNAELHNMRTEVKMAYSLLKGYGAQVSAKIVRDVYKEMSARRYAFSMDGLTKYMREREVQRIRFTVPQLLEWHISNKVRCVEATRTFCRTMALNFERFLNYAGVPALPADQFTPAYLNQFLDYMRNVRRTEDSYINEHIVLIKAAVKAGVGRDYLPENRLSSFEFRFNRNKHTTALTPQQLEWLEITDFTQPVDPWPGVEVGNIPPLYAGPFWGERMQQAVDLFVFCCYTAFHHCDRQELADKHEMVLGGAAYVKKVRRKTRRHGATAIVKQSPTVRRILKKYGSLDTLPRMPYKVNYTYLYRLGRLMGLPYTLATGHARNTFVYMGFNVWGFDGDTIALMAGLKSPAMLAKYNHPQFARVEQFANWPAEEENCGEK